MTFDLIMQFCAWLIFPLSLFIRYHLEDLEWYSGMGKAGRLVAPLLGGALLALLLLSILEALWIPLHWVLVDSFK